MLRKITVSGHPAQNEKVGIGHPALTGRSDFREHRCAWSNSERCEHALRVTARSVRGNAERARDVVTRESISRAERLSEDSKMLRTLFKFVVMAVLALMAINAVFGLAGLFFWFAFMSVVTVVLGAGAYVVIAIVSPRSARKLRERFNRSLIKPTGSSHVDELTS